MGGQRLGYAGVWIAAKRTAPRPPPELPPLSAPVLNGGAALSNGLAEVTEYPPQSSPKLIYDV